jgi:Chromo (CHRromatin Organisation MOdifier) domain
MHAVHPVFHVFMLELSTLNYIPNCIQPPFPLVIIDEEPEYEISKILDSKLDKQQVCKLLYLVQWSRYEDTNEKTSWIPANELSHASEIVSKFYFCYPNKPGLLSNL